MCLNSGEMLTLKELEEDGTLPICIPRKANQTNTRSPSSFQQTFSQTVNCELHIMLAS